MCKLTSQILPPTTAPPSTSPPPSCIPSSSICQKAYAHAAQHLHPLILAHSLRVYLYATHLSTLPLPSNPQLHPTAGSPIFTPTAVPSSEQFFLAAIFHDTGTTTIHDHNQRFEVCGADAAVHFLQSHGSDDVAAQRDIWSAISLHTSPGIAERMSPLTRLLRMAVKGDFGEQAWRKLLGEQVVRDVEEQFPRGEIEKVLGDFVAEQGVRSPEKAPSGSWPGNLVRAKLEEPGWEGVNKGF